MTHKEPKGRGTLTISTDNVEAVIRLLKDNRIQFKEMGVWDKSVFEMLDEAKREVVEGIKKLYENEPYLYHREIDEYASSLGITISDNK